VTITSLKGGGRVYILVPPILGGLVIVYNFQATEDHFIAVLGDPYFVQQAFSFFMLTNMYMTMVGCVSLQPAGVGIKRVLQVLGKGR
jgi:hypothetical protein